MATTYRQALNRVLEIIGEDKVPGAATALTADYHLLVGAFFNDIMEQVQDAHNWRALRTVYTETIPSPASGIVLTGSTQDSRLIRLYQQNRGGYVPLVFDATSGDTIGLQELDLSELKYRQVIDTETSTRPVFFALDNTNANSDGISIIVHPAPSSSHIVQVHMITPQARADWESQTTLDTNIKVPVRPLVMGTVWYCLEDRGEELGTNALFSEQRFMQALDDAVARDAAEQGDNMELVSV